MSPHGSAAWATAAAGAVAAAVGAWRSGAGGAIAAVAAAVLVLAFFSTSGAAVRLLDLLDTGSAALGVPVVLMTYVLRLLVVLTAALAVAATPSIDVRVFGGTLIAAAVVWPVTLAAATRTARPPVLGSPR